LTGNGLSLSWGEIHLQPSHYSLFVFHYCPAGIGFGRILGSIRNFEAQLQNTTAKTNNLSLPHHYKDNN